MAGASIASYESIAPLPHCPTDEEASRNNLGSEAKAPLKTAWSELDRRRNDGMYRNCNSIVLGVPCGL